MSPVRSWVSALSAESLAKKRGRSTVVVRLLAKEKVVSSNLIARSDDCGLQIVICQSAIRIFQRRRGQVAKARVCKTLIMGSNPIDASKNESARTRFVFFIQMFSALPSWVPHYVGLRKSHRRLNSRKNWVSDALRRSPNFFYFG